MDRGGGRVLRYFFLPGFVPRIREFAGSGFSRLAYIMALAFQTSRLLPPGHPYVIPSNVGKFGIRHVLSAARRNLVHTRNNADQVILYYAMLCGLFMLGVQAVFFAASLFTGKALAATGGSGFFSILGNIFGAGGSSQAVRVDPSTFRADFFEEKYKGSDVAYKMLDQVFCFEQGNPTGVSYFSGNPIADCQTAFHTALHATFGFYSGAVIVVAGIILLYYMVAVVAETAQSGTPFGRRFTHAWVPVRLILAAALLTPYGPNHLVGAQHMMLQSAKFGSAMASKGWLTFNGIILSNDGISTRADTPENTYTPAGLLKNLTVKTDSSEFSSLLEYGLIAHACRKAEYVMNNRDEANIKPYQISGKASWEMPKNLDDALKNIRLQTANMSSVDDRKALESMVVIRFGEKADEYSAEAGSVRPLCGEITFRLSGGQGKDAAYDVQAAYYGLIYKLMYEDEYYKDDSLNIAQIVLPFADKDPNALLPTGAGAFPEVNGNVQAYLQKAYAERYERLSKQVIDSRAETIKDKIGEDQKKFLERNVPMGWAGAGIWYNRIAKSNGNLVAAVYNMPSVSRYPEVMEYVLKQKSSNDKSVAAAERFSPYLANGRMIEFQKPGDLYVALALYHAQTYWTEIQVQKQTGNFASDAMRALNGLEGLIRLNKENKIHPLAQISGVGRALVESSITLMGLYVKTAVGSLIAEKFGFKGLSDFMSKASATFRSFAAIGFSIGFLLYYVIPLLPFVYFFFAVSAWIKGMFEAMVGAPLWALAFIRMGGEGIPGQYAMQGFMMMLEIFMRPLLIVTGLVSSVIIYNAQVDILHEIWPDIRAAIGPAEVLENSGFFAPIADLIDGFFFMIMYGIVVYSAGLASFKMIDLIPNNVMRWLGTAMQGFGHYGGDAGQELLSITTRGTTQMMQESSGLISKILGRK